MNRTISDARLLKLAAGLDRVKAHRFEYGNWVGEDWEGRQDLSCGTTACALGHAATMPEFRRLGLRLTRTYDPFGHNGPGCVILKNRPIPEYHEANSASMAAAMEVFGISYGEAVYLFYPLERPPFDYTEVAEFSPGFRATPKEVAAHIRQFVKKRPSRGLTTSTNS